MNSAYWYYVLVVISLLLVTAALRYKRDWKLLVLHLAVFSVIHPLEIVILATNGYQYFPNILPASIDNYMGAYISDFLIVPASAVYISVFSLPSSSIFCCALIFTFVDWLFTVIGVYQHFWWKSIYTGIGLIILYPISGWLWSGLQKN